MSIYKLAVAALAPVAVSIFAASANAAVVDFEEKVPFYCEFNNQTSGGLSFAHNFAACFYGPTNNADYPTPNTSVVMGIGFSDITITKTGGGTFDFNSTDLSFGPFQHSGLTSDTTLVTGNVNGGGTLTTTLTIGYGFQTYVLNWANLDSIVFGQLAVGSEYIGFDNIDYNAGPAVPEPATWGLMIAGFGLAGTAMRRRRVVAANG